MITLPLKASTRTIEQFQQQIELEFCQGSAIDKSLFASTVQICSDLEIDTNGEPVTPIHSALNWSFVRFGQQVREMMFGALLLNEDGSCWQAKLSRPCFDKEKGKPRKYETPKGNGSRAFLPFVPASVRRKIADRYGVEVPVNGSFWQWLENHPEIPITLTEGGKKSMSLLSLGYVAIALYGVNGGYVVRDSQGNPIKPRLIPDVARFATAGRSVHLAFDQDSRTETRFRVRGALFRFGGLLQRNGCKVSIAEWSQLQGKGVDDLVVNCGVSAWHQAYESAIAFDQWQTKRYTELSYEPNLLLNQEKLGVLPVPDDARLICLKSRKGSGKTWSIARMVEAAHERGQRVLLITHRIQLTEALCGDLKILSVYEVRKMGRDDRQDARYDVQVNGMGLVIDSLHPASQAQFKSEDWQDCLVIIDEAEQVLWHLFNSSTCKGERVAILQELKTLLENTLASDGQGKVALADADLTDVSIDFIRGAAGRPELKPFVVLNEWKPEQGWNVHLYKDKESWVGSLCQAIGSGQRVLITEDSQQLKGRFSTSNLEKLLRKKFPHLRILRIDSETLDLKNHAAFGIMNRLNEMLLLYDIVLCSPSVETGVSIDIREHFNSVWSLFQGTISADSARQSMSRLREPVDRHLWVATKALNQIGRCETSVKSLLETENKLVRAHLHQIFDSASQDGEIDSEFMECAMQAWAKMAVRINAQVYSYGEAIVNGLRGEGHTIISDSIGSDRKKDIAEELTANRNANQKERSEAIASAEDLDDGQFEEMESKAKPSLDALLAVEKHRLKQRYSAEVTPDLYLKDCDGFHGAIRLHYYLTAGSVHLPARDKGRLLEIVKDGKLWSPDANRSLLGCQVRVMQHFDIPALLSKEEWSNQDAELIELRNRSLASASDLKKFLGFTVTETGRGGHETTPIEVAQKFLDKMGLRLAAAGRKGSRGNQVRIYKLVSQWNRPKAREDYESMLSQPIEQRLDDGRFEIFDRWLERDKAKTEKPNFVSSYEPVVTTGNRSITANVTTDFESTNLETTEIPKTETGAIGVGSLVRKGTSFATWIVEAVEGTIAKIRQTSGYAAAMIFTAPLSELRAAS